MIERKGLPTPFIPSQPLDLGGLGGAATIQPEDLVLALAVLSTPMPPSRIVLPQSLLVRRRLGRSGLVFAADRRQVPMEIAGEIVSAPEALGVVGVDQTLPLESYDLETSDRMRVVSKLEGRLPLPPDTEGRRYYWIDGLMVASGHSDRDFFHRHADQCYFELIDNVHRWAGSDRAVAVVSATAGGGDYSHNRLHIVVADNGIGIIGSAREKATELTAPGQLSLCLSTQDKPAEEVAVNVIADLLSSVYGKRHVVGAQGGHGLNTIANHVLRWHGTMNVITSFSEGRVMHRGRRGKDGKWRNGAFNVDGIQGTLVHFTLDAVNKSMTRSSSVERRELVSV